MTTPPTPRIVRLPARRVAVAPHPGDLASIDRTRKPLYQHMIMHEAVGGPSMVRFRTHGHPFDVLVAAAPGYGGTGDLEVEELPAGAYAVLDYEGPEEGLAAARESLLDWVGAQGRRAAGPLLQVHLMDPIDGVTEQQLQVPLA